MASGRVIQCFLNADLRSGHDGLTKVAKAEGVNVGTLQPGEFVVFINSSHNRVKVYAAQQVIAYLKMPKGKIDLHVIREIPRVFQGGGIDYDKALAEVLGARLKKIDKEPALSPLVTARKMKQAGLTQEMR